MPPDITSAHAPFSASEKQFLSDLRRDLHRFPELSWQEKRTQARLEQALIEIGVQRVEQIATTGLVAYVSGTDLDAAPVAIRGDIDALPITEATGLPYASERTGVMHACGHDVHAAWAVGAALSLLRKPARAEVRIILQPAEEVGEGASAVLASGALDGVAAIFGGHVDRTYLVGQFVAQAGPLSASTDTFAITLHGQGAHGARPQEARDPIVGLAALVLSLQTIVSRIMTPGTPAVVSVGAIEAGRASNVIPDRAMLVGTVRATTADARDLILAEIRRIAASVAGAHRLRDEVVFSEYTPPLINDRRAADCAAAAVRNSYGGDALVPLGAVNMGGEDFAYYLERIPGCFLRIGAREAHGSATPAHSPGYYPSEDALYAGAGVLAECARVASNELTTESQHPHPS